MLDCDKAAELIPLYIDNGLSEEERALTEEHLLTCESCKRRYEDLRSLIVTLYSIEDEAPPEGFHDEFMDKLRNQAKPEPAFMSWNYKAIAQAAACAAAVLITASALSAGISSLPGFSKRADQPVGEAAAQAKLSAPVEAGGAAGFDARVEQYALSAAPAAEPPENGSLTVSGAARGLPQDPIASSLTYYNIELTVDDIKQTIDKISQLSGVQVSMNYSAPAYDGARGSAFITRRAAAREFEIVKDQLRSLGSVTNESESKESRSRQLMDLQARLTAKDAEKDRLLDLLGMSGELDVMIRVESRLNSVADESDGLNAQLRDINREIGQPYLNIQLYNRVYARPAVPKQGLGARMANSFNQSVNSMVMFMQNLLLFVVSAAVPVFVCSAFAALIFILLRRLAKRRKRGRKQ